MITAKTIATDSIALQSARLKTLFGWVFGIGAFLLFSEAAYRPLKHIVLSLGTPDGGAAWRELVIVAQQALPAVALLAAVYAARRLFKALAQGAVLSVESSAALGRIGDWLIASAVLGLLFGPYGLRFDALSANLFATQIVLGCVGLAIRLVGRIHRIAAELKADHEQIV